MPYFHNDDVNILFIHIPKTGGSSIEQYLAYKYKIPLNNKSLFMFLNKSTIISDGFNKKISLQHQTYDTIYKYRDILNVNFDNKLIIFTIVRNPYTRIMSDLFHLKLIKKDSLKEEVFTIINKYIITIPHIYDNHNIPQYKYIIDSDENIINNIKILRIESLKDDMKKIGFNDFNIYVNKNKLDINNYDNYLNDDSIKLINNFYEKDFILFNYPMKSI
jgi:hypothetical protein